jgi:hypothetical protein
VLEVVGKFPLVLSGEMNQALEEEVSEEELRSSLSSIQNEKILGPNGFTIEIYKSFYDL